MPAEYSASWIETVSAETAGVAVLVRGAVAGATVVAVAVERTGVGVGEALRVEGKAVDVGKTAVRVGVGNDAPRLISNERATDHAPFVPPPVRARTRHQKRRSLVKVCVVWVWLSPACEATKGALKELESSNWIS